MKRSWCGELWLLASGAWLRWVSEWRGGERGRKVVEDEQAGGDVWGSTAPDGVRVRILPRSVGVGFGIFWTFWPGTGDVHEHEDGSALMHALEVWL